MDYERKRKINIKAAAVEKITFFAVFVSLIILCSIKF